MPRIPVDYTKTIIYKISRYDEEDPANIYIGHTTDFYNRKSDHKRFCNNPDTNKYNFKIYQYIRNNGGWDNFNMLEIEKYPCADGNEARAREEQIRVELGAKLNSIRAFITGDKNEYHKEQVKIYYENNKEKVAGWVRIYSENNKEKVAERRKEYYENNKEKIAERGRIYRESNKDYYKNYRENNKEKIAERMRIYRESNKEKLANMTQTATL
jgi:hypothetical protein